MAKGDWWIGKGPRIIYRKSMFAIGLFLILMLLLSMALHPAGFSFQRIAVSPLGYTNSNPMGSYFFNIGFAMTGIILIPHTLFLLHHLASMNTQMTKSHALKLLFFCGGLLLLLSNPGMAFVGLTPENLFPDPHLIAAIFAFGGLFFGAIFLFFPLYSLFNNQNGPISDKKSKLIFHFLYFQLIAVAILNLSVAIIPALVQKLDGNFKGMPDYWPITEWSLFGSNLLWYIGIVGLFTFFKSQKGEHMNNGQR